MICKNCGHQSTDKYCGNCTQEMDTHRLTFKHFISHDILHGLFHLDGKLPRTLKAILINPGKVANEYIAGKRKKYYSFFYLLLMLLGAYIFFDSLLWSDEKTLETIDETGDITGKFIEEHFKTIVFLTIPFIASVSWLLLRRLKYNIIEFHVFGVVVLIGYMTILLSDSVLSFILNKTHLDDNIIYDSYSSALVFISIVVYPLYALYSFVNSHYSLAGKIWRVVSVWFIIMLLFVATAAFFVVKEDVDKTGLTIKEYYEMEKKNRKLIIEKREKK